MEVNDYVRIDGYISKIEHIKTSSSGKTYAQWKQPNGMLASANIIIIDEFNPNIIDLIEENDLIEIEYKISTGENQKEIVQVIKNVNNKLFIKIYTEHYVFIEDIEKTIYKIKGIITHEQIESMEYKVKE